ncbi:hypothetical protein MNBD_ALPHA09-397 [hydrothermal vent metagenome]|uniref:Uncharacterized protein n=1 Tax=hydrothermal vent metagenome TaxID=652676 RepID=A0A3B0TU04_9ZZZZ
MARHFWHGATGAAILLLSANSLAAAPLPANETAGPLASLAASVQPLGVAKVGTQTLPEVFRVAQIRAKTTRDVERERAEEAKKKQQKKKRRRRATRKAKPQAVNAPPPAKKPQTAGRREGSGVSLAAALITGGPALTSGVVWTVEPLSGEAPPTVTTNSQPTLSLPAGQYRITAKLNDFLQSVEVDIPATGLARLDLGFNAARLKIKVLPTMGAMPLENARIRIVKIGVDGAPPVVDANMAAYDEVLPAGIYRIEAALGLARVSEDIGLTAGANRTVVLNLSVGYVRIRARPAPGQEPLQNVAFELLPADGLDAAPQPLASKSGASAVFTLPAGTYRIVARYGEASRRQLVDIAPNTFSDIIMDLDAGQLVATLADLPQGSKPKVAFRLVRHDGNEGPNLILSRSGAKLDVGLPVGSYTVIAELEDGRQAEKSFIVEPGVRTEIALAPPALPPAQLTITAGIVGGGKLPDGDRDRDITISVTASGTSKPIANGNLRQNDSLALPGGDYEISATHRPTGAKISSAVSAAAGSKSKVHLEFPLGVASLDLAEASQGSDAEWVLTGIDGKPVARHLGAAAEITLKPGEYVVTLTVGGTANTAALSITEGKVTPVKLPLE